MFTVAVELLGGSAATTLVIGDRLDTDIAGANNAGLPSVLVLTGVSKAEDVSAESGRPDAIYAGLPELLAAWR